MWHTNARSYIAIREGIDALPVIETHEHWTGICPANDRLDILAWLADASYYQSDLGSASGDFGDRIPRQGFSQSPLIEFMADTKRSFEERYAAWRPCHERTRHTAYSRAVLAGLRACWGLESIERNDLLALQERMRAERNQAYSDRMLERHGIRAMIVNAITPFADIVAGRTPYRKGFARFVMDLPQYHELFGAAAIRKPHLEQALGRTIVTLDDYLEAFERFLDQALAFGIVGFKDQTAYRRAIDFGNPARASAEAVFNRMIAQPRDTFGTAEVRDLDDYLFNRFMRLAARHRLPVQVHTGHMAGLRNEIAKANPVHLTPLLELHADVEFDLFHGGWPYMGEFLFLGKNYPNVNLDLCWVNSIDPAYSVELMRRAVMTVPHSKVLGFGGDTHLFETQVGALLLARDNLAIALAELVESGWLGVDDATALAKAWLFDNPGRVFKVAP